MENQLDKIRSIADYQFGKNVGEKLFPENVTFELSKRTGRIRFINLNGERLATLRPTDSLFSLSIKAAKHLVENIPQAKGFIILQNDVSKYIAEGGDVFAVHVIQADDDIRAKDEVIIIDQNRQLLAVGRAALSAPEIRKFKTGVAVKVRHGINSKE
ncbi:MAG: pseudouridine synthase [Candidatus Bathyarchaeota archaeon]|nr:pseudouridine synthase [Candidatus Termiticorpusculum sp.]MCL2691394.1 pseudouridine synthase [Candidatus Termiticorpusculum sp.]MCL2869029.1 pseudouridine synthase [Candidatus Termiticorpusculum sp.]